jgi:hypothetical protein
MAYTNPDFRSKKALREAVAAGERVEVFSPGPFGCKRDGDEFVEGPHYPKPHSWYAAIVVADGLVVKVKS